MAVQAGAAGSWRASGRRLGAVTMTALPLAGLLDGGVERAAIGLPVLALIPVFGVSGGVLLLGESLAGGQIVGAGLVAAALAWLNLPGACRFVPRRLLWWHG